MKDLQDTLDIITTAFVKVGRIMRTIRDERLYREDCDTFEKFCSQILGKGKRYVNRIIQAEGVIQALLEEGVEPSDLPDSERLCRELSEYPSADMKKIWAKAKQLALLKGKAQPDGMTVREAAVQIEGTPRAKEKASRELIAKIEAIARQLRVSIGWEQMDEREAKRLVKALATVVAMAASLLKARPADLEIPKVEIPEEKEASETEGE